MENLWEVLEEEKRKAQVEKMNKEKSEIIKEQYNVMKKEYNEALSIIEANYIFNYFLLETFPVFIKKLIENNHNALLKDNIISGKITLSLETNNSFEYEHIRILKGIGLKDFCTNEIIYYFENDEIKLMFKNPLIYNVFKEKLIIFLAKNNIINLKTSNDSNLIYANPIYFEANIEDLINAAYNALQQIEEEKEDLKVLMDMWNIEEGNILRWLNIFKNHYYLINSAKEEIKLSHKK